MSDDERRAVITGMGVLSGSGRNLPTFWQAIVEGRSASRTLTRFEPGDMPTRIAAELDDFEPSSVIDAKAARRMDLSSLYGITAAASAVEDAGLNLSAMDSSRVGVAFGTSLGALGSTLTCNEGFQTRGYRGTVWPGY